MSTTVTTRAQAKTSMVQRAIRVHSQETAQRAEVGAERHAKRPTRLSSKTHLIHMAAHEEAVEQERKNRVATILQEMLNYERKRDCSSPESPQHWVSISSCYDGEKKRESAWVIEPGTEKLFKAKYSELPSTAGVRFRCRGKRHPVEWIAVKIHTNHSDGKRFYWSLRARHTGYQSRFLNACGQSKAQPFAPLESVGQE
jgi:hypothetical protein